MFKKVFFDGQNLESRWWHRLFKVTMWGGAITIAAYSLFIQTPFYDTEVLSSTHHYSFESGYEDINAKEDACIFKVHRRVTTDPGYTSVSIKCGALNSPVSFINRYGLFKDTSSIPQLSSWWKITTGISEFEASESAVAMLYEEGRLDDIKFKTVTDINYISLVTHITIATALSLLWLILALAIYRLILYIVLGANKMIGPPNIKSEIRQEDLFKKPVNFIKQFVEKKWVVEIISFIVGSVVLTSIYIYWGLIPGLIIGASIFAAAHFYQKQKDK
ncbi:MAG: hypothetical protein WD883_01255 [Candidatus Colwellbacteria bacterium]